MTAPTDSQDLQERIERLQARLEGLNNLKTKLRKLNIHLGRLAVAQGEQKKMGIIASSSAYLENLDVVSPKLKTPISCIYNELQSIREGIRARAIRDHDMVVTSGVNAVNAVNAQIEVAVKNLQLLQAQSGHTAGDEEIIRKNAMYRTAIKPFGNKPFQIARVPVTFTFQNKQKHSQVGYIDNDRLDVAGFKAANLGGYTVLYDQLVIGLPSNAHQQVFIDPETQQRVLKPRMVKDVVQKFKGDKPVLVEVKRPMELRDLVQGVIKQLEAQTRHQWTLMSDTPSSSKGIEGSWFWVMPTADVKRLSAAFPGGFFKVNRWGLAF